jgi:diguanylate cyclase (GGDEF)-like protein
MKIITIEDSEDMQNIYKIFLKKFSYELINLKTLKESYKKIKHLHKSQKNNDIELIILDYFLPDGNGLELCHWMKLHGFLKDTPIIMISSNEKEETILDAFNAGISDYIKKPFSMPEFLTRINYALRLKKEIDLRKKKDTELNDTNKQLEKVLVTLSKLNMTDALTNIFNRRYFDTKIRDEWKRCQRSHIPLGLAMIDIDYFKLYNDTYGHQKGDECLIKVAQSIKSTILRPGDFVCRYGGEEFIAVLPNTNQTALINVCQRILKKIRAMKIKHESSSVNKYVSISIGAVTKLTSEMAGYESLIKEADEALYIAKKNGRNTVIFASKPEIQKSKGR